MFQPGTFELVQVWARQRGRPHNTWKFQVYDLACQTAGGEKALRALWNRGLKVNFDVRIF